ncbi:MAG TPA: D-hexose-6-phosphate mutarotase [Planctomycetaceae bacterium]|jgi:glucose-6-phosphate 1-epimerase|nr:D-hexose-6-phosphate mutarotase [Planctomycetaceae bacterium]
MNLATVPELDRRFGIPGIARVVEGNGGLAKVAITTPASAGGMYLHGAHVTSWQPRDAEEVLFVSTQSRWEDGRAIRGGIPICFPWFADKADDPSAPAHGFVRTKAWQLESVVRNGDAVTITMSTQSDAGTKKWWPADFHLLHRATFGCELGLELVVTNTGPAELRFEEALHTYFRVGQIEKVRLQGLDKVPYLDKTDLNREQARQGAVAIVSETDRIYLNTQHAIELEDDSLNRHIHIAKANSLTTVLWNPWVQKARNLSDLGDDEWRQMVCVETSNVSDFAVKLAPGQEHTMRAIVRPSDR